MPGKVTDLVVVLKTGLTPSASGSAYLELQPASQTRSISSLIPNTSSLKLTCTVHGPRPQPRSAPFSPQLILTTHVKFAPFATRTRRGYIRDAGERDLSAHLESALRGVIIGDRWPKSGAEVIVTILEGEEDGWWADPKTATQGGGMGGWGIMNVLAGCITVASAALVEAGIDCVDVVSGGVAALVRAPEQSGGEDEKDLRVVVDPCPAEHENIVAGCVVGYLASRDELVETWIKGDVGGDPDRLIDKAVEAAIATRAVVAETLKEAVAAKLGSMSRDQNKGGEADG